MSVPDGYSGQTFTIEFTVDGNLDGTTLCPVSELAPSSVDDPQSIYRPAVISGSNPNGNLGLINIDYVVPATGPRRDGVKGNRYIHWFWLESPVAGVAGASLQVVDALDGTFAIQKTVQSLVGRTIFYTETGILVPQGSLVRILGYTNPGATPIKLRMHVSYVSDQELIAIRCCARNITPISAEWTLLRNKLTDSSDPDYVALQTLPAETVEIGDVLSIMLVPRDVNGDIIDPTTLTVDLKLICVARNVDGDTYIGGSAVMVGASAGEVFIENCGSGEFTVQLSNFVNVGAAVSVDVWVKGL